MKYEQYEKLITINEYIKCMFIEKVMQEEEKLLIDIIMIKQDDTEKKAQISFDYLLTFKSILESYALKSYVDPKVEVEKSKNSFGIIYEVKNSQYIDWFYEESCGITQYAETPVNHYAVYGTNFCVDILASESPEITYEN